MMRLLVGATLPMAWRRLLMIGELPTNSLSLRPCRRSCAFSRRNRLRSKACATASSKRSALKGFSM